MNPLPTKIQIYGRTYSWQNRGPIDHCILISGQMDDTSQHYETGSGIYCYLRFSKGNNVIFYNNSRGPVLQMEGDEMKLLVNGEGIGDLPRYQTIFSPKNDRANVILRVVPAEGSHIPRFSYLEATWSIAVPRIVREWW